MLKKSQVKAEHTDREKTWGHKDRDALKSYLKIREEIIRNHAPALPPETVGTLAKLTRGLMKRDIEKCVDEYTAGGGISYKPDHPTNTCDPYTGNWTEHLMDTERLRSVLEEEGFNAAVLNGYYSNRGGAHRKMVTNFLNLLINNLGQTAAPLAPYYILFARYQGGA